MISYSSGVYFSKMTQVSSQETFNFIWKELLLENLVIYIIEGLHKWNKSHHCDLEKKIILSRWGKIRWTFPAIGKSNKETGSQRWKIKMAILRGVADIILLMGFVGKLKIYTVLKSKLHKSIRTCEHIILQNYIWLNVFYQNL